MYLVIEDFKKPWLFVFLGIPLWLSGVAEMSTSSLGWCKKPAQDTLRMFDQNPKTDPKSTPYFRVSVAMVSNRKWWHGARTNDDCVKRTQYLLSLRRSIARGGIKEAPTIHIKGDGRIQVWDGYHRLFCADYMGYKKAIPVKLTSVDSNFLAMEKIMLKLGGGKEYTYHPINDPSSALYHPYFRNWKAWRIDTPTRYQAVLAKLGGDKTVLDIGACEGYFSINLAARGYDVTAVELNPDRAKVLRFFANLRGLKFPVVVEDWQSYCARTEKEFDAAIFLSTFHHRVIHGGLGEFGKLGLIRAKKLFFEMATCREPKMAKFPTLDNSEIVQRVLENTKFTRWEKVFTATQFAPRDIFMFT